MINVFFSFLNEKSTLLLGLLFLVIYWIWGYDGIAFSDEVTYLHLGQQLWSHESFVSDYHFTSRWGAFLFSGFFTYLLGFSDRYASLATLAFYLMTLYVVWHITPSPLRKWAVLFFIGNVYLLHFLTKVYPDGFLILWVTLIPAAAVYRNERPFAAACVMAISFFIGFCTKETVVFLAPFPLLLLFSDLKRKHRLNFYYYFAGISLLLTILYLGYYHWQFGDWLYRFKSIENGHYVSDYSYYDKGLYTISKRITYEPILDLINRTYWLWLILAVPSIYYGVKKNQIIGLEFAFCSLCLVIGFWWMSSSFQFYSPLPFNPRHLIILVAPLSVCIALGSKYWLYSLRWRLALALMLVLAAGYCLLFSDWKIGIFYILFSGMLFLTQENIRYTAMAIGLLLPVLFSVYYQQQLKNYPHFIHAFRDAALRASDASPLLTHDFVYFSREVLLQDPQVQTTVVSMTDMENLIKNPPDSLTLLVYEYYRHAYPGEQEYLDYTRKWIEENYNMTHSEESPRVSIRQYSRLKTGS